MGGEERKRVLKLSGESTVLISIPIYMNGFFYDLSIHVFIRKENISG